MKYKKGDKVILDDGRDGVISMANLMKVISTGDNFEIYSVKCTDGSILSGIIEHRMELDKQWYREVRLKKILG